MHTKAILCVVALSFPLSSQIYDSDEPQQPSNQTTVAGDTVSGELPAPLPEATIYKPRTSPAATTTGRVELMPPSGENLETAKKLASMGAGLYFTGLGLAYGVGLPLRIAGLSQGDEGLYLGGSIVQLVAAGFRISGATRNGIGAGIAYNFTSRQGIYPDRNINWGFYKAGWAFAVIADLTSVILQMGGGDMDGGAAGTISIISLTSSIAMDVMWTVGVANSLSYVRNVKQTGRERSGLSVVPVYSAAQKSMGAVAVWTF